jgi:multidrug efflux pump subunit AcrA (membrane-fusion protein)
MRLGFCHPPRSSRALRAGLALAAVSLGLAACQEVPSNLVEYQPFELEPVEGTDLNRVKIEDTVAERIDLTTAQVRLYGKNRKVVPHAALIYNPFGDVFVYTRPEPQTYVRAPVAVDRVIGNRAVLAKGPPAGTVIVTIGAAELLATEYEILNQHP